VKKAAKFLGFVLSLAFCTAAPAREYGYQVVKVYPHDPTAFPKAWSSARDFSTNRRVSKAVLPPQGEA